VLHLIIWALKPEKKPAEELADDLVAAFQNRGLTAARAGLEEPPPNSGLNAVVLTAAYTPEERERLRAAAPDAVEAFIAAGDPPEFAGRPPEAILNLRETPAERVNRVLKALELLGRAPKPKDDGFGEKERELVEQRLKDLGYL
jgi:hypothetical protein